MLSSKDDVSVALLFCPKAVESCSPSSLLLLIEPHVAELFISNKLVLVVVFGDAAVRYMNFSPPGDLGGVSPLALAFGECGVAKYYTTKRGGGAF